MVCFHGRRLCRFCFDRSTGRAPKVKRARLRCPTCGRFVRGSRVVRCPACVARGFEAMSLFDAA